MIVFVLAESVAARLRRHGFKCKTVAIHVRNNELFTFERQAPSLRGGGLGMRYTCRICGKEVWLFEEEGRWFVEW